MKCECCEKDIPDIAPGLFPDQYHHIQSKDGKMFCGNYCLQTYYIDKITQLTKSDKTWHDEWYKSRDSIGKISLELMYVKHPEWRVKNA